MQVNCNAGSIKTNLKGEYRRVEAWYMPKGTANIFSMNEIEKLHVSPTIALMDNTCFTRIKALCDSTSKNKAVPTSISMCPLMIQQPYGYRWYAATMSV